MTDREDTLELLVDAVRRFAREVLIPAETEVAETNEIPHHVVEGLQQLGLFGMTIPEEYGGLGLSMYEEARLVFEVAYAQPAFRSYFGTTNGVGTLGIVNEGTEEQKRKYLPKLATGEMMASFCLTEPDSGSDSASLTTRCSRRRSLCTEWNQAVHHKRHSCRRVHSLCTHGAQGGGIRRHLGIPCRPRHTGHHCG